MKKKTNKNKNIVKILIGIICILGLIILGFIIFEKIQEARFKKMLQDNDANNYELVEVVNRSRNESLCKR
ncbi:MAG: hypothetical protein IJ629_02230 [Clostridia bacterium]|nr:hypothetical protein [Clostridia bacterium]